MKRIRVSVTQADIDAGDLDDCPIALAIRREGYPDARVTPRHWYAEHGPWDIGHLIEHANPLPKAAQRFVRRFDAGLPVEPETFDLPVPQ